MARAGSSCFTPTAVISQFAEQVATGVLRTGRAEAVVIEAEDPLDDIRALTEAKLPAQIFL